MKLHRPRRPLPRISLIPLVDVLLILLVFFMVTSTFLDLDMIPLAEGAGGTAQSPAQEQATLLLRLSPEGEAVLGGNPLPLPELPAALAAENVQRLLVLPSPMADVQALVAVLDIAAGLGIADVRVVRLGGTR